MDSSPQQIKAVSCLLSRLTMPVSPLVCRVPILEWWLSDSVVIVGTHCVFFVGRSVGRSVACCLVIPFHNTRCRCLSSVFVVALLSAGVLRWLCYSSITGVGGSRAVSSVHQHQFLADLDGLSCMGSAFRFRSAVCIFACSTCFASTSSSFTRECSCTSINLLTSLSCVVLAVPLQYTDPSCEADI